MFEFLGTWIIIGSALIVGILLPIFMFLIWVRLNYIYGKLESIGNPKGWRWELTAKQGE